MRSSLSGRRILGNRVLLVMMTFMQAAMAQIEIHFTEEPRNVTVQEHDNVYVPCRSNTSYLPSWMINGKEYGSSLGLPGYFLLNTTHLIIPNITLFLDGTVVQCFVLQIVPDVGVVKTYSTVGVITVSAVEQFFATSSSVLPEPGALTTSYMHTSTASLKYYTSSTKAVDLQTSSEDVTLPTVVTINDINEVNLLAVWSSLAVGVSLLFFVSIAGVALIIILVNRKSHRQHIMNHPINPNLNPAYDTWVFLERRQQNHCTETGIKTEMNCAYAQRKDFVFGGHKCTSGVGEQV